MPSPSVRPHPSRTRGELVIYVHLCMSLINLKRWAVNNHTYYGYLAESCVTINMKDWYPQCSPVKQVTPSSTLEKESIKCIILTVMYIISLTRRCFSSKQAIS